MTQQLFDFEGAAGNPITGTNIAIQGTGGSATFENGAAFVGNTGGRFVTATGQVKSARLTMTTPSKTVAFSPVLTTPPSLPATTTRYSMASLRDTAPSVAMRVEYDEFGQIGIEGKSGGFFGVSATAFPVNTDFRIQIELVVGTTTTPSAGNSTVTAKVYSGTNLATLSGTGVINKTNFDAGTLTIGAADVGCVTAGMPTVDVDYVLIEDGRTTEFGALPTATSPTANAGADHYQAIPAAGAGLTLTGAASSGQATGVTYLWECTVKPEYAPTPSITGSTSITATATNVVDGVYQWRLTVTNPGAAPSTDLVDSYIWPLSNEDVKVRSTVRSVGVTIQGAVTDTTAQNDTDPATALRSPDNPAGSTVTDTMNPFGPGPIGFKEQGYWTTADTGTAVSRTVTWQKEDASALQAADTPRVLPGGLGADATAATEANHPLGDTALAVIGTGATNRRALKVITTDTV